MSAMLCKWSNKIKLAILREKKAEKKIIANWQESLFKEIIKRTKLKRTRVLVFNI